MIGCKVCIAAATTMGICIYWQERRYCGAETLKCMADLLDLYDWFALAEAILDI